MVVSNKITQLCLHYNIETNKESFLVCKDCGLILDETPDMKNDDPYYQTNSFIKENTFKFRSPAPLHSNTIGSKYERAIYPKRLTTIANHYKYDYKTVLKIRINIETNRILSLLDLPLILYNEITKKTLFFYSQLQEYTKFRSFKYLTPFTIYLTCLERNIFINKSKLFKISTLNTKSFNQLFISVLRNNKSLQKKLRNNNFRKNLILNGLSGYINQRKNYKNGKTVDHILKYVKEAKNGITTKELEKILGLNRTLISWHLRNLRNKDFIYAERIEDKKGLAYLYKFNPDINLVLDQQSYSYKELLKIVTKILEKYWNLIKKHTNRIITALVFSLTRDYLLSSPKYKHLIFLKNFTDHSISKHLGLEQSSLLKAKEHLFKLLKKMRVRNEYIM